MRFRHLRRLGVLLQLAFLISLAGLIYFEKMNFLGMELGIVVLMFGISMGILFVSEKQDDDQAKKKVKVIN